MHSILPLGQEKAFDRVDWSFLFATLYKMGFGGSVFIGKDLERVVRSLLMGTHLLFSFIVEQRINSEV